MDTAVTSAYAQLLSIGVLWVSLHCAGMCGPLVLGLGLGRDLPGSSRLARIAAYQTGKAAVYAALGALAGVLGQAVTRGLTRVGPSLAAVLGVSLMVGTLAHNLGHRGASPSALVAILGRPLRALSRYVSSSLVRAGLVGAVMAGLPCMLVGWALTLAASTRSALHGAGVMVTLVALTTVPLALAVHLPLWLARRAPRLPAIGPWLGMVSGAWLLLVAAGAAGTIHHASLGFEVAGRGYVMMFW